MTIEDLRILCKDETIQMTSHVLKRCRERNIKLNDIKQCIMYGEIIEEYPDDYPFPSALVMECNIGTPLHIVAGIGNGYLWIITAYIPSLSKWESDYKTRKENNI
ncbi:MAG: DUF4258 domain-containing protein [Acutalibacteraceae bacterium]|nr:DUF4258 domain-containing protein [Acutalibacteraceae bacterium]